MTPQARQRRRLAASQLTGRPWAAAHGRLSPPPPLFHRPGSSYVSEHASAGLRGSGKGRRQVGVGPAAAVAYRAPERRCLRRQSGAQGAGAEGQALELAFPEFQAVRFCEWRPVHAPIVAPDACLGSRVWKVTKGPACSPIETALA